MPPVLANAFYADAAIGALVVRPVVTIGRAFADFVDPHLIDAAVRDVVWLAGWFGREVRALQTGLVRGYAFVLVAGAVAFLAYFVFAGAPR
jgi:NADH:ubiquinone oxidoreductase subunit 5 (subunit L)/multisubunit Na+/H+ antiporter MnhA subunit